MGHLRFCCGVLLVVCCLSYIAAEEQVTPKPETASPKDSAPPAKTDADSKKQDAAPPKDSTPPAKTDADSKKQE